MHDTTPYSTKSASQIPVDSLVVWYHFPFSILQETDLSETWDRQHETATFEQANYFHPYVEQALWGHKGSDRKSPLFERHVPKSCIVGNTVFAHIDTSKKNESDNTISKLRTWFRGKVFEVELRQLLATETNHQAPGIGILVVGIRYDGVARQSGPSFDEKPKKPSTFDGLTLADTQQILNRSRRVFPRWFTDNHAKSPETLKPLPGDTLTGVLGHGFAPSPQDVENDYENGQMPKMPWVQELLSPYTMDGVQSQPFGDERSYITSCIVAGDSSTNDDQSKELMASISQPDLFRLAEVDGSEDGYPYYQRPFLDSLYDEYFYNRHAYDTETQTGSTTQYLLSQHHLCTVTCGEYGLNAISGKDPRTGHVGRYYRHMQFLCVFEYFRLLQFSQQLSRLVNNDRQNREKNSYQSIHDSSFAKDLFRIRQEFLDFTHLHHFSNVSTQLQPREMFEKLYRNFGIADMFTEVEQELKVATDFLTLRLDQEGKTSAEKLNNLISLGVPLSLIVGAGGMNIFIGAEAPALLGGGTKGSIPWDMQLAQLLLLVSGISGIWALGYRALFKKWPLVWTSVCIAALLAFGLLLFIEIKFSILENVKSN